MHLPGHMMPFSQSLANQGMQQTNDNINSMNMQNSPEQNINQAPTFDYTNFVGGSMNLGMQPFESNEVNPGNNIMSEAPFFDYSTGEGVMPEDPGNPIYTPDYGGGSSTTNLTGDALAEYNQLISSMAGSGLIENFFTYDWQSLQNSFIDLINQQGNTPQSVSDSLYSLFLNEYNTPSDNTSIDIDTNTADNIEPIFGNFQNIVPGSFDLGFAPNPEQQPLNFDFNNDGEINALDLQGAASSGVGNTMNAGFLSNLAQTINPVQSSPQQFTGGGGQGGQAARRLYFPGTSGGFASVGTGIGGGGTTLDDLLRKMR